MRLNYGKAKQGFGKRKKELVEELRDLERDLDHYVVMGDTEKRNACKAKIEVLETELDSILVGG